MEEIEVTLPLFLSSTNIPLHCVCGCAFNYLYLHICNTLFFTYITCMLVPHPSLLYAIALYIPQLL